MMKNSEWGLLSPEQVSTWINFNRDDKHWQFDSSDPSMATKQAQGVAYLWNLLSKESVALLADEVGMGKTIQALGVAALLWKKKPNAKILVMAPNKNICQSWIREFNTFVELHYREADHLVKNGVDGGPVPSVHFCQRLEDLAVSIESGVGHLYLTTIYSLSNLVSTDNKGQGDKNQHAARAAEYVHSRIKAVLPLGFDLIIIDEAHYLRNTDGGSQRVAAARGFFGDLDSRLASKTLLLTATPTHTRISDVRNILSYFLPFDTQNEKVPRDTDIGRQLLQKYALRRLRLLEGKNGFNSKHQYRHEKETLSSFKDNPNAEMFFALYQKRLVADMRKEKEHKSLMYGYLEGFESIGRQEYAGDSRNDGDDADKQAKDWTKAQDTELLQELTRQYFELFKQFPEHPKYGSLVNQCVPKSSLYEHADLEDLKHLIFVRRIPSVRELTQRINAEYDDLLASMIIQAWGVQSDHDAAIKWKRNNWSLEGFKIFCDEIKADEETSDIEVSASDSSDENQASDYLASRIAELFVVKREQGGQVHTANVRLRFSRPESIFSLFLEPSSDYLMGGYFSYYQNVGSGHPDYANAALHVRQRSWPNDIERRAQTEDLPTADYQSEIKTVWSLVFPFLNDEQKTKLARWSKEKPTIAENFANYLKAGFLHASPVVVELYCWFVKSSKDHNKENAQRAYRHFFLQTEKWIKDSLLLRYFSAALDSFDSLCGKIFDHAVDAWEDEWRSLKGLTSPAWYASGDIAADSRQRLLLGFNSPFYPNVLVATSVFKEGVNLHMACHQVHHYGLAGSPGDNEQRVGRIDRLFGCVNNRLKKQGNAELSIYFPFLSGSVDEDQVASFIQRKYRIEDQMDACLQPDFDKHMDIDGGQHWKQYLRKPAKKEKNLKLEPYPPKFENIAQYDRYQHTLTHTPAEIIQHIESHFTSILDPKEDVLSRLEDLSRSAKQIFVIDPVVKSKNQVRRQPVVVEKAFNPNLSAFVRGTVYVLSLVSPIAVKVRLEQAYNGDLNKALQKIELFLQQRMGNFPLVRACINEKATNSYFYLNLKVDLPVFSRHGKLQMLSEHELRMAFEQLVNLADDLEFMLFEGEQDIGIKEMGIMPITSAEKTQFKQFFKPKSDESIEWQSHETINGNVCSLVSLLNNEKVAKHSSALFDDMNAFSKFHLFIQLNQKYPFVNFVCERDKSKLQLAFPEDDLQALESELFKAWFGYINALVGE